MVTIPNVLGRPLSSLQFPFIWFNTEKKKIFRKAGGALQVLDETQYADLYTVFDPALLSIAVTGTNTVAVDASVSLTATGTYDDESSADLTTTATWTSSDETKAIVDNLGNVTGVAEGEVTITATVGAIASSAFAFTVTAA